MEHSGWWPAEKKNMFYQMDETRLKTGIGVGELVELQKHHAVYDLLSFLLLSLGFS